MELKQYEIVIVKLDPTIGSETKKTRPCLIVSPDEMNAHLRTITIVPITSHSKPYPTRISFRLRNKNAWAMIDQIRTIDRRRVHKIVGKLSNPKIKQVKEVLKETFVD